MEKIGKYRVLGLIGSGAEGVVYKAVDPDFDREVAIKIMPVDFSVDPDRRARFFRMAKVSGKLKHVNIVTVYDLGEQDGRPYLVMEFLDGRDLRKIIHKGKPPTLEERVRIMLDICHGLAHAHDREVIHRDIKPSNIFVTTSEEVKILDFGLARILSSFTKSSAVMGTLNYMPPEQYTSDADHRADIFASGAVFYELLTLKVAFDGENPERVLYKITYIDPEPVESVNAALPAELSAIIRKAVAKDPDLRYQSIKQMALELETFRATLDGRKSGLKVEAEAAVRKLRDFVSENEDLLRQNGSSALENLDVPEDYLGLYELRERAARDLERLQSLAEKRRELAPLVSEAAEHAQCGRLESAAAVLERLSQVDPDNLETGSLLESVRAQIEEQRLQRQKQAQAAALFLEAESRDKSGDLPGCIACLDEALRLQPEHVAALQLRYAVQKTIEERAEAVRMRVKELIEDAGARILSNDFHGARNAVEELSRLDPGNPSATSLQDEIRRREAEIAADQERQRQAEVALSAARKALALEDLDLARNEVERARSVNPGALGIDALISAIERAEEKKSRRARIAVLLAQSRQALSMKNFEEAAVRVREALQIDSQDEDAAELLKRIDQAQEETGRRVKIDELLVQSEQALRESDFQKASLLAREVLLLDQQNPEAQSLLGRIGKVQEAKLRHPAEAWAAFRKAAPWMVAAIIILSIITFAALPYLRSMYYGRIVRDQFNRGLYDAAVSTLAAWLAGDPRNGEALMLRSQTAAVQANLSAFESAVKSRNCLLARVSLARVQSLNSLDPETPNRWSTLEATFSPEFLDEFLGGLGFWKRPQTWRAEPGRMIVRGAGIGILDGRCYEDFTASFNLAFLNGRGAVWVLRAGTDLSDYYMFQLTGPRGNPPNSFAALKSVRGKKEVILSPIPVGANLGIADDQFNITVKATGGTIEHQIELVSDPTGGPRMLGKTTDTTLPAGTFGFGVADDEEFAVRAFKILPVRKYR